MGSLMVSSMKTDQDSVKVASPEQSSEANYSWLIIAFRFTVTISLGKSRALVSQLQTLFLVCSWCCFRLWPSPCTLPRSRTGFRLAHDPLVGLALVRGCGCLPRRSLVGKALNLCSQKVWSMWLLTGCAWLRQVFGCGQWGGNSHPAPLYLGSLASASVGPLRSAALATCAWSSSVHFVYLVTEGWSLLEAFVWEHVSTRDRLDLSEPCWDAKFLQHSVRNGWCA